MHRNVSRFFGPVGVLTFSLVAAALLIQSDAEVPAAPKTQPPPKKTGPPPAPSPGRVKIRSAAPLPHGAQFHGDVVAGQSIDVTLHLRSRGTAQQRAAALQAATGNRLSHRRYVTRSQHAATFGAAQADVDKVASFATHHGMKVLGASQALRTMRVRGSAQAIHKAFGVKLKHVAHLGRKFHSHAEHVTLPADLAHLVEHVSGLDTRASARPHSKLPQRMGAARAHVGGTGFSPLDLANLYGFPQADGTGQVVGIIELGGGFKTSDLQTYFQSIGVPMPQISVVTVDGSANSPGPDPSSDQEVALDIEVVGALVPRAKIVVYFAPNTDQGFVDALNAAVHDQANNPSVISLSWGFNEVANDPTVNAMNQILQDASTMGVTVCVASGDSGSRDNPSDPAHACVDFPASSPFALGCGATSLRAAGQTIAQEAVWHDKEGASGGGVSRAFKLPSYQASARVPRPVNPGGAVGRGVPDVAGNGDPETGYRIFVAGQPMLIGGTSAVAPLWAGLTVRLNQKVGKPAGFLNPILYANPGAFRDVTAGNNGDYKASQGWDPCTGLGSPTGDRLLQVLQQ